MKISVAGFKGMIPRASNRQLPEQNATISKGANLLSGELRPFRKTALAQALDPFPSGSIESIYRWWSGAQEYWLQFPSPVDVVRGPIADDVWQRIYWTGDSRYDEPRMAYTPGIYTGDTRYPATSYKLGVPAPENQIIGFVEDPLKTGDIAEIYNERPIRVETVEPHGLVSGDLMAFDITDIEPTSYPLWDQENAYSEGDRVRKDGDLWQANDAIAAETPWDPDLWTKIYTGVTSDTNSLADLLNGRDFQVWVTGDNEVTLSQTDIFNVKHSMFDSGTFTEALNEGLMDTRFYVHTYVTEIGEEGPPSDPSESVLLGYNQAVTMTLPGLDISAGEGRLITKRRIYRTATGDRAQQFQFVAELDISEDNYRDDLRTEDLAESLRSIAWDPPHQDMTGLRLAANGFAVGFYDNVLCHSEPYRLHAWPTDFQDSLDYDIVAVETIDSGTVVATTGRPYLFQGIRPDSMVPRKLEVNYACASARSMVSLGYSAIYAADQGLVMVSRGGAELITRQLLTEDDWRAYKPETIHAYEFNGRYIAFYGDSIDGGALMLDPREPEIGLVELGFWCRAAFHEPRSTSLYLLVGNDVLAWNDPDEDPEPYQWRSKLFTSPRPMNLAAAKVVAESYDNLEFRLYDDNGLVSVRPVTSEDPFWLPGGYLSRSHQFELVGTDNVAMVEIAEGMEKIEP